MGEVEEVSGTPIKSSKALAPTKVTLFGEHAVVYGKPALVLSIPVYVEVETERADEFSLESGPVSLNKLSLIIEEDEVRLSGEARGEVLRYFSYILESLNIIGIRDVRIRISSPLPVGAGLGTSAAVTVGTIAAASKLNDMSLTKEKIAELAWEVEKRVQGRASPMDTSASALGGALLIRRDGEKWIREKITINEVPLVIGLFKKRWTTGELVARVAKRLTEYPFLNEIIEVIGDLTMEALNALESGDLAKVGELMNVNHGLLESLGVVTKEIAEAVHAVRMAGALGAKVSGAGGGGAVVALGDNVDEISAAFKAVGAERVLVIRRLSRGVEVR
ncbi:mevalonate kinase [Ignicoccus pacificus DSM 13166]|uniref:Mevalonate kinase n=1 Tax=Ignicoccus pacificus DSM 13166 TaxID=940294 RepID=A0A977KA70_9CREN|nr:mevalonate kinase [Ignicoccus pacificus DSM 13166]